jgi:hypothetical protein
MENMLDRTDRHCIMVVHRDDMGRYSRHGRLE